MKRKTKLAAGAGAALAAVGAGGAIAATKLSPDEASKTVVEDAAKQLGVAPEQLNAALKQALENRIDAAAESGRITKETAESMKQRLESQDYPFFGEPALGGFRGGRPFRIGVDTAAGFLGLSQDELREAIEDGKSLAQVAKDRGKPVDGLVDALVDAQIMELDKAVANGRLTTSRRDDIVSGLRERTEDFVIGVRGGFRKGHGFGFRGPGHGHDDLSRGA